MQNLVSPTLGRVVYVDVDGTLLRTDLLFESAVASVRADPSSILRWPVWLARGRARLKANVAALGALDVSVLPYRAEVIGLLRERKAVGEKVILASAADRSLVDAIARHLGFVDGVLASDGEVNLKGAAKADAIESHARGRPWTYVGDSQADLAVWERADDAVVVNRDSSLVKRASAVSKVSAVVPVPAVRLRTVLRAVRIHQWLKNILIFLPLFAAHVWDAERLAAALMTFVAFGMVASANYLLNDLWDVESDRKHPVKRRRPIAAGELSIPAALTISLALAAGGLALGALASPLVPLALIGYLVLTITYSVWLKRRIIADVIVLSTLYTYRIITGAIAVQVAPSPWLLAFSMFLFTSLALVKRCGDLVRLQQNGQTTAGGRDYHVADLRMLVPLGGASGLLAILVLALYIDSETAAQSYANPSLLWAVCPIAFYWIGRVWIKVGRGEMNDDPIVFAARDRTSRLAVAAVVVVWTLATVSFR